MSTFFQEFLRDKPSDGQRVSVAAFGKHPAWGDDHFRLGLDSRSLTTACDLIYSGLRNEIESGKLAAEELAKLDHSLLWRRGTQSLAGRIWYSGGDGERRDYPMAACAHCLDLPASWVVGRVLPRIERLAEESTALRTRYEQANVDVRKQVRPQNQEQIKTQVLACEADLQKMATQAMAADGVPTLAQRERFLKTMVPADSLNQLKALLMQFQQRLFAYAPGALAKGKQDVPITQRFRLPGVPGTGLEILTLWHNFLAPHLDGNAPILFILPPQAEWVDLIVGEPRPTDLGSLYRGLEAIPLEPLRHAPANHDLADRAGLILEAFGKGTEPPSLFGPPVESTTRFWSRLGLGRAVEKPKTGYS